MLAKRGRDVDRGIASIETLDIELVQAIYVQVHAADRPVFRRVCQRWRTAAAKTRALVRGCDPTPITTADNRDYARALARLGWVRVIEWAQRHGCRLDSSLCVTAAGAGHLAVIEWAYGTEKWPMGGPPGAKYGSHHCACGEHHPDRASKWIDSDECAHAAAAGGHTHVIAWLRGKAPMHASVCDTAAQHGHIETIAWTRSYRCPWDADTCAAAARGGRLTTLRWLRANKCPWSAKTYHEAVKYGHAHVAEWARASGCPGVPHE